MAENLIPEPEEVEETPAVEETSAEIEETPSYSEGDEVTQLDLAEAPVISDLRRKRVYAGMWGPLEIAVAGIAAFLLLISLAGYLFFVVPAERELAAGRNTRDDLDSELRAAREKWGDIRDTESQVKKLLISAEDFEFSALREESLGTTAVYQRINVLINAYDLKNTSGPDYVPLEVTDAQQARQKSTGTRSGRDKYKSLFPGIYVTTTVEGSYSDLRRFMRDIETSQEFVAITSVELEPADEQENKAETQAVQIAGPNGQKTIQNFKKGRYRGSRVSLRIEMAAYFRRPGVQRMTTSVTESDPALQGSTD